ncbi:hypothetical protein ACFXPS_33210 [Nocardia sp. NPDC059091]|uniref:hypothetical protein n=1 Tax=unclassified Nocardia TaxID=2637762 RepID=UPI0036913182
MLEYRVHTVRVGVDHPAWPELDRMALAARRLRNAINYDRRQMFFADLEFDENTDRKDRKTTAEWKALPVKVAREVSRGLDADWRSFAALRKTKGRLARPPKYLRGQSRYQLRFAGDALRARPAKRGMLGAAGIRVDLCPPTGGLGPDQRGPNSAVGEGIRRGDRVGQDRDRTGGVAGLVTSGGGGSGRRNPPTTRISAVEGPVAAPQRGGECRTAHRLQEGRGLLSRPPDHHSYTSKTSVLAGEQPRKQSDYAARRISRGRVKVLATGQILNADVNGACQIARKCRPDAFSWANGVSGEAGLLRPFKVATGGGRPDARTRPRVKCIEGNRKSSN